MPVYRRYQTGPQALPWGTFAATLLVPGLAGAPFNPIFMSIRQERVPIASRARVFGTLTTLSFIAIPLGRLVGGYVAEWIGVQTTLGTLSIVYFAVVLVVVCNPVLQEIDEWPYRIDPAAASPGSIAPGYDRSSDIR